MTASLRTTLRAPDAEMMARAWTCAGRFRSGEFRHPALSDVRPTHRDAVFLMDDAMTYEVHVWGDPAGHVRAYAYRRTAG